jgi:hypothetical protein
LLRNSLVVTHPQLSWSGSRPDQQNQGAYEYNNAVSSDNPKSRFFEVFYDDFSFVNAVCYLSTRA